MINKEKKNVLMCVHEISPVLGSECSSGWNFVLCLSAYHNLTVLHAESNQFGSQNYSNHIQDYFKNNPFPNEIKFVPVKQPVVGRLISALNKVVSSKSTSIGLSFLFFLSYRLWQKKVHNQVALLLKKNKYDLIHNFNALSYREPGYLFNFDLPFFWGPISGLDNLPKGFYKNLPLPMLINSLLRSVVNRIQLKLSIRLQKALKKASRIYAVTKKDYDVLSRYSPNVVNMLDVGTTHIYSSKVKRNYSQGRRLKIIWVGRHDYLKALDILLYAISGSNLLRNYTEVLVIGDGPQNLRYKQIALENNIENVRWFGYINKDKVMAHMTESDILVHTSLKEAGSAVILEALSCGLPVLCHDAFGMAHTINEYCGIKVGFKSMNKSVVGFRNSLEDIIENPELIEKLSLGAIARSVELTWDSLAQKVATDYSDF